MEVNYSKEETMHLIEEYYRKLEGREVKASIKACRGPVGIYEEDGCITTISITEKMDIGGIQKDVVTRISQDQLKQYLKALFTLFEFKVSDVTINDGVSSRWEGYGMMEHQVCSAYFKGVTLNIEKMQNKSLKKVNGD